MKKIQYRYTHLIKQVFLLTWFLLVTLNLILMVEIVVFKVDKYYDALNIPLTVLLYLVMYAVIIFLFTGYKYFYSRYDENRIIYYNKILRKEKSLEFDQVSFVHFDKSGVKFYEKEEDSINGQKPIFFLPFFRNGVIEAIDINNFYKMLMAKPNIKIKKSFTVLPGYTKKWTVIAAVYAVLALGFFMNTPGPLTAVIVLFQNH